MDVVFDTNVIISRYLSPIGIPAQLLRLWRRGIFTLVVSEPILQEYRTTLLYDHLQALHHKNTVEIDRIVENFRKQSRYIIPTEPVTIIQNDPADNKFLACALAGNAEYIVSGDHHLLDVGEYRGIRVLRPTSFLRLLEKEKAA